MQVILLEKIENLGTLGQEVKVRNGFARNHLLPKRKALRATDANRAYFERERAALEAGNTKKREAAEKESAKLANLNVVIIRQASEAGHLYGSVSTRDIADAVTEASKMTVARNAVQLNESLKSLGVFPMFISLHPEVKVEVKVNVARTAEEAEIQAKTGKAIVVDHNEDAPAYAEAEAETEVEAAPEADTTQETSAA